MSPKSRNGHLILLPAVPFPSAVDVVCRHQRRPRVNDQTRRDVTAFHSIDVITSVPCVCVGRPPVSRMNNAVLLSLFLDRASRH